MGNEVCLTLKAQIDFSPVAPIDGVESAISAWAAFACGKALGQELSAQEEHLHAGLVASAKTKDLDAWGKFKIFTLVCSSSLPKSSVDSRWVLTWKMVDGVKSAKARLVAKGFQDPDLQEGLVDTSGCVSLRSSHLAPSENGDYGV